jgi:hypothetical protein
VNVPFALPKKMRSGREVPPATAATSGIPSPLKSPSATAWLPVFVVSPGDLASRSLLRPMQGHCL